VVLYRAALTKGITCLKHTNDEIVWLKLDKEFFGFEKTTLLALCYLIPVNSSRQDTEDTDFFDRLLLDIAQFRISFGNCVDIFVSGDFNARTADRPDYVSQEDTVYVPLPDDYIVDHDVTPRTSMDTKAPNAHGYSLLDMCKSAQLRIVNGRVGNDINVGKYTCHTARGNSVVDYLICDVVHKQVIKF
jgi:hypothetical protein